MGAQNSKHPRWHTLTGRQSCSLPNLDETFVCCYFTFLSGGEKKGGSKSCHLGPFKVWSSKEMMGVGGCFPWTLNLF